MTPLDERALRRPGFVEGVPIVLSDGQTWTFPRPVLGDAYFAEGPDGALHLAQGFGFGENYEALVEAYVFARDDLDAMTALAELARDLLRRNYDLAPGDLRRLLRVARGDGPDAEASRAAWDAISGVATGRAPKGPTSPGSAPPSSPTGSTSGA